MIGEFGLFAGVSFADEDLVGTGEDDTSPLFGLRWATRFDPRWNWFADADYTQHATPVNDDSKIFELRTGLERLWPLGSGRVNLYAAGGLGLSDVNYPTGLEDFSRPMASLGLGLASARGGLRGEVRAVQLLGDNGIGGADVTNLQLIIGWSFPLYAKEEPLFRAERRTLTLEGVNFEFDTATLTQDSHRTLDRVAASLRDWPDVRVEIGGHSDKKGTPEYNLDLSHRRAHSVRDYLISKRVSPSRLEAKGYGETRPVASNDTEEGRAKNRRVELKRLD